MSDITISDIPISQIFEDIRIDERRKFLADLYDINHDLKNRRNLFEMEKNIKDLIEKWEGEADV